MSRASSECKELFGTGTLTTLAPRRPVCHNSALLAARGLLMDAQQRLCGSEATREWLARAQIRKGEDWVSILHELIPKIPLPPDAELHLVTTAAPTVALSPR